MQTQGYPLTTTWWTAADVAALVKQPRDNDLAAIVARIVNQQTGIVIGWQEDLSKAQVPVVAYPGAEFARAASAGGHYYFSRPDQDTATYPTCLLRALKKCLQEAGSGPGTVLYTDALALAGIKV